jgi:hypothetical protein
MPGWRPAYEEDSGQQVRSHLERIRDKTGARRRAELVRHVIQAGIDPVAPYHPRAGPA